MPPRPLESAHANASLPCKESVQIENEGGLAAAICAGKGDGFAGVEAKVDAIERDGSIVVTIAEARDFDQRRHAASLSAARRARRMAPAERIAKRASAGVNRGC